jgi:PEP-CTERM motif
MKRVIIASLAAVAILTAQAQAQTNIVFYSFNVSPQAPVTTAAGTNALITANIGSSISQFSNSSTSGSLSNLTILSSVGGNPNNRGFVAGNSISQNGWNGNNSYFQFTLDATGYQNLVLEWTGNVSSTGPATNGLWYSTDGGSTFTLFSTFRAPDNAVTVGIETQDLSSVTALNNDALDVFRIYGTNVVGGAIGASGTEKIDNFSIDAIAVPEPSTMLLVGAGVLGMFAIRRRRS